MSAYDDRRVAIIGAGLIGRSWSMVFAAAGWGVQIADPDSQALRAAPTLIAEGLERLAAHELVTEPGAAAARVRAVPDIATALDGVAFVQECGPETLDAKHEIFALLDAKSPPDAIIASSSSGLYASQYTETLRGRHRCLVGHPVNPPHLVPVVEVCATPWTAPEAVARTIQIYSAIGQVPVTIRTEIDGFVVNRLQGALLGEALRLVGDGVISPQDLDRTIKDGLGLRWSFMGPFETIDLNAPGGIGDYCLRYTALYRRLAEDPPPPSVWEEETIGRLLDAWGPPMGSDARIERSAWRDRRLAALKAHKQAVAADE